MKRSQAIIITGQTGTGKTNLALRLARELNGELISADSRQVYKELNIGTGKYSKSAELQTKGEVIELEGVPIFGLNLRAPDEKYSAGEFTTYAREKITEIEKRNKIPIIIGGTGFYIKSLIQPDATVTIPQNDTLRAELASIENYRKTKEDYLLYLQNKLQQVDSKRFNSMNESDNKNPRRLVRAIEVAVWKDKHTSSESIEEVIMPLCILGLWAPKSFLTKKITARVNEMIKNNYIDEVTQLKNQYTWSTPGLQTIGYKEWKPYFDNTETILDVTANIINAHLQYARKQLIYLKRLPGIKWWDVSIEDWQNGSFQYCKSCLQNLP